MHQTIVAPRRQPDLVEAAQPITADWIGEVLLPGKLGGAGAAVPKILTIIHGSGPGGVERVSLRLNAMWRRMGARTQVLAAHEARPADLASIDVDYRVVPGGGWLSRHWRFAWLLRELPALVREAAPDLLFCPGNSYTSLVVMLKIVMGRDCPPIVAKISNDLHRHDMNPVLRFLYRRWLWLQGRMIDRFVAMAPAMVMEIEQLMHVPASRITIINDPVLTHDEIIDYARLRQIPALRGRRFIAVGRLAPQKNFGLLLDAFARMARADDRLTILGEGRERAALEKRAAALGIAAQVSLPGHVDDVRDWLANADIFCMSSDFEGVPAVLIEAIAARLPVVATDCSASMGELIGHGRFGTLVPVGDAAALAEALDTAPIGQALPAEVLDHVRHFSLEAGARAYLGLGEAMIGASSDSRVHAIA